MSDVTVTTAGKVVVIGATDTAKDLAEGLRGRSGGLRHPSPSRHDRAGYQATFAAAATGLGSIDLVVFAHAHKRALSAVTIAETSEADWIDACESTLDAAYRCAQAAHPHLAASGGQLVFVVPTISMTGAAGFCAYAAAAEGIRALAKGMAKTWGHDGIRVNTIALGFSGFADTEAMSLVPPALGVANVQADIAPAIALLSSPDAHFITGATLVLDGGIWTSL